MSASMRASAAVASAIVMPARPARTSSPTTATIAVALWRMPRSPSTVRFACGSGNPYRVTPGVDGSPAPIE
jgi:hypothetical protein